MYGRDTGPHIISYRCDMTVRAVFDIHVTGPNQPQP